MRGMGANTPHLFAGPAPPSHCRRLTNMPFIIGANTCRFGRVRLRVGRCRAASQIHTRVRKHTDTHARTHAHTRTQTRTHAHRARAQHTHTHTHTILTHFRTTHGGDTDKNTDVISHSRTQNLRSARRPSDGVAVHRQRVLHTVRPRAYLSGPASSGRNELCAGGSSFSLTSGCGLLLAELREQVVPIGT